MSKPAQIWLYRTTHIENLPHILRHGLVIASSPSADPNFRPIGDQSLIGVRKDLDAPNPPGGKFSEYIPFYLGHRSPMLYQIATGYEGVEKIPQSDIVYVVVNHDCIVQNGLDWFYTDGHARHGMTRFYTDESGFDIWIGRLFTPLNGAIPKMTPTGSAKNRRSIWSNVAFRLRVLLIF